MSVDVETELGYDCKPDIFGPYLQMIVIAVGFNSGLNKAIGERGNGG